MIHIIGAGIAGLYAALKLAPHPVVIVSPSALGDGIAPVPSTTASSWAQGGIAAAIGPDDSPENHIRDTLAAGSGHCNEAAVRLICESAPACIDDLIRLGVPFDRAQDGSLSLGLEAAHSHHRIARIQGDRAGAAIMRVITRAVREAPHIQVLEHHEAIALSAEQGRLTALCLHDLSNGEQRWVSTATTLLATGGIGSLYEVTTNPFGAYGSGIALAASIGATLADLEFVQFHPTALLVGLDPAPLATEALRGEGAQLLNDRGERFMLPLHPLAELAPRDVVARAIHRQIMSGRRVYLDARTAIGESFAERFPTVFAACKRANLNPQTDLMPISPAAHYHIGGVATDLDARTSIAGLYACGECACTGAHGANRLASNSLLESLVFASQAATHIKAHPQPAASHQPPTTTFSLAPVCQLPELAQLRHTMTRYVGIERSATGLESALDDFSELLADATLPHALRQMASIATRVADAALARPQSLGCHFRSDAETS